MKILYHHRVASKDGQYVHIAEIIASLKKRGHEVIVCEPASIEKTEFGEGSPFVDRIRAPLSTNWQSFYTVCPTIGNFVNLSSGMSPIVYTSGITCFLRRELLQVAFVNCRCC
jgi:hypothetical protein